MLCREHLFSLQHHLKHSVFSTANWHDEECVVREPYKRQEHKSKENVQVHSLSQSHVAQCYEEGCQTEENQRHWVQAAPERHQRNYDGPKTENAIHTIHLCPPFLHRTVRFTRFLPHYIGRAKVCKREGMTVFWQIGKYRVSNISIVSLYNYTICIRQSWIHPHVIQFSPSTFQISPLKERYAFGTQR
jgi:hypothetical protein